MLVAAGFALTAALLLPGGLDRRRALAVVLAPLAGLLLLAAVDLATAHGSGHFSGSVLHARSAGELRDLLARHYETAWEALRSWPMALATLAAVAAALAGVRRRERIAAGDPGFLAAFAGGLLAGAVGALVEDSGPLLLLVAVFTTACAALYLHYGPSRLDHAPAPGAAG